MRIRRAFGQASTEYMLTISVIVVAVVASAYLFVPEFQDGVDSLGCDVSQMVGTGAEKGIGFDRASGAGNNGHRMHTKGGGSGC